jgi:hypothetical protein
MYAHSSTRRLQSCAGGVALVYVPWFSMPMAWLFWPGACAPTTVPLPFCSRDRDPWRPSITYPPRLTVRCWPVSTQPLAKCHCWMSRAIW